MNSQATGSKRRCSLVKNWYYSYNSRHIHEGANLERMNTFKYLYIGATLAENGYMDAEMTQRIQSGWKNWKRVSGILCDRRISLRFKGKVYKTVVRPAMI